MSVHIRNHKISARIMAWVPSKLNIKFFTTIGSPITGIRSLLTVVSPKWNILYWRYGIFTLNQGSEFILCFLFLILWLLLWQRTRRRPVFSEWLDFFLAKTKHRIRNRGFSCPEHNADSRIYWKWSLIHIQASETIEHLLMVSVCIV